MYVSVNICMYVHNKHTYAFAFNSLNSPICHFFAPKEFYAQLSESNKKQQRKNKLKQEHSRKEQIPRLAVGCWIFIFYLKNTTFRMRLAFCWHFIGGRNCKIWEIKLHKNNNDKLAELAEIFKKCFLPTKIIFPEHQKSTSK